MNVLWCGGEDIDFPNGIPMAVDTSATYSRSGYAREAIIPAGLGMAKSTLFPGGAVTTAWLTARLYWAQTSANYGYIGFGASGTVKGLFVGSGASHAKAALFKYDGSTWTNLGSEAGTSLSTGSLHRLDVMVTNYGAHAVVDIYIDLALVITLPDVDVTVTGMTNFDSVFVYDPFGSTNNTGFLISEIIVADEDTRALSLVTMAPTGAGTTDDWTGAYTDISETTINDATEVYTNTVSKDEQFNITNLPAGTFTVKALKVAARCAKSASATAGTVKLGFNVDGAGVDVDAGHTCTTAWQTFERYCAQNPKTTNDWQQSEMNPLQLDFQSAA